MEVDEAERIVRLWNEVSPDTMIARVGMALLGELELRRRTMTTGGPPPPVDKFWANRKLPPPETAESDSAPPLRRP